MILTLARDNSGRCVGLQLPAEPADIAAAYEKLDAVSTNDRQTRILRADTGVGSLDCWLRDRKMDRPGDYIELGELAEKIGQMDEQQRKTFDGALAGAAFNSVADVLRIADSLGEYIFIHGVTTEKELGRFLVDTGYKGFPESVKPYLDYEAIGIEYYAERGGAFTGDGYTLHRGSAEQMLAEQEKPSTQEQAMGNLQMQSPFLKTFIDIWRKARYVPSCASKRRYTPMASIDARKEEYEHVELFGKPALFTDSRISRFTVPQGWFCYDLRGKDSDPSDPATIEKYVGVNHAGTILSPAEIPFKKGKDFMPIKDRLNFFGEKMTLEEFCAEQGLEYPADTRKYAPRPASHSEAGLFYALKPELDELLGGIGHLRVDFGRRGTEFWTSWFDHCGDKLNTPEFKTEIDKVVNELRETVLKDRSTMRSYCADFGGELGESLGIRQYGYVVETEHYRYCLRCKPQEGDYDAYLWTFDRRVQEMNQAQKEKEIQTINEQIRPFDIQMHALSDYYLALRFSFFEGEDAGYGQAAFDAYAASKGEEPVDGHGCHARGSGYDWDEVFRYAFRDTPGFEKLQFNSEAGCFFCDCADLELLKNCALTMKGIVEDRERFTKLVREALDSREQQLVGRLTFANGDVLEFTDPAKYVAKLREEIDFISTTGMKYETLTDDPQTRKAVDDIVCGLFGEDNPRPLEDYQATQPTMTMGGM